MPDRFPTDRPADGAELPAWALAALRAPVAPNPDAHARLMRRVRQAAAAPARGRRARPAAAPAWSRRRGLASLAGLAAAALLGVVALGLPRTSVPVRTLAADGLRDPLHLVRFVLAAPAATRLAIVGDFNGWDVDRTPMRMLAESTGVWAAAVRLPAGVHRYAFVVDDTGWVADPARPAAADTADGARSTVTVAAPASTTAVRR